MARGADTKIAFQQSIPWLGRVYCCAFLFLAPAEAEKITGADLLIDSSYTIP